MKEEEQKCWPSPVAAKIILVMIIAGIIAYKLMLKN